MRKSPARKKKLSVRRHHDIPEPLREAFLEFLERHPARRLSRNLRTMLLEFLMREEVMEAPYLKDLLFDLEGLFALLDVLEKVQGKAQDHCI